MLCKLNPWLIFPLYTFENFTLNIHLFGTQNAEILVPHCWLKTIWNDYNSCKNKTPKLFEVSKVLAKKKITHYSFSIGKTLPPYNVSGPTPVGPF